MGRRLSALSAAAAGATLAVVLGAAWPQAQGQVPGAIRVWITLVPIDVVVTDKDDRPVNDLKASDFTILEDGVRQEIAHFSLQAFAAMPPDASPASSRCGTMRATSSIPCSGLRSPKGPASRWTRSPRSARIR
jgi:hypothetical protein